MLPEPNEMWLLDIFIKGDENGIDLARELRESRIPFVYISANSNADILHAANDTQPEGFIVKPFRKEDSFIHSRGSEKQTNENGEIRNA